MGDLVSHVGRPAFGREYFHLFNSALAIEHCTVFAFRGGARPAALVAECTSDDKTGVRSLAREYVTGAFVHDPNIHRDAARSEPLVYALRADDLRNLDYRRHFYDEPALSHELVLLGDLDGTLFYSSFYRSSAGREFQPADLDAVQLLSPFAIRALRRHLELQAVTTDGGDDIPPLTFSDGEKFDQRRDAFRHLRAVLLAESRKLSPREADVCASIVLGYSTSAIGLNLGISVHTVATHRKRAYSKLGISSQNELFWKYFTTVSKFGVQMASDHRSPHTPWRADSHQ